MAGSGCWTRQDIPADPAIQEQNNTVSRHQTQQRKLSEVIPIYIQQDAT